MTLIAGSREAAAEYVVVTTTEDAVGDDGVCSLREAVTAVTLKFEGDGCFLIDGPDQVKLLANTYNLEAPIEFRANDVDIIGQGFDRTFIDGGGTNMAFHVQSQAVGIANLTIKEFQFNAVWVDVGAAATLSHVRLVHNGFRTDNTFGPCVMNQGITAMLDSECSESSGFRASAILNDAGTFIMVNSSILYSNGETGVITNQRGGSMQIINSTIAKNEVSVKGSAVLTTGSGTTTIIENSTIAYNHSYQSELCEGVPCAALMGDSGTTQLRNTIVAHNTHQGQSANCGGDAIESLGFNVMGQSAFDACLEPADHAPTDITDDPELLTDSAISPNSPEECEIIDGEPTEQCIIIENLPTLGGGLAPVYLPGPLSPVLNRIPLEACPTTDQRSVGRQAQPSCDIGAVERTSALFVRDGGANTAGDEVIESRLEELGYDVDIADDQSVTSSMATGHAVVVISNSVVSDDVGATFRDVPQGVLIMEPWLYDDMGMVEEAEVAIGLSEPITEISMSEGTNIARSFGATTGLVTTTTSPQPHGYGLTDSLLAGVAASYPPFQAIFHFPPNRELPDGSRAAGHRIGFFAGDQASAALSADGVRLLDLAIMQASSSNNYSPVPLFATFEGQALNLWYAQQGSLTENASEATEGFASMSVNASGYTRIDSVSFGSDDFSAVGDELLLDVYVPAQGQPNPYYLGAVQMYVTIPSAGVYNQYLGQAELTPHGTGWRTLSFDSEPWNLSGDHDDISVGIAINTPHGAPAVLLDNLRFSAGSGSP